MLISSDGTVVKRREARHDDDTATALDELDHQHRTVVFIPPVSALSIDQQDRIVRQRRLQPAAIRQLDLRRARRRELLASHPRAYAQLLQQRVTREWKLGCQ